MESADHKSSGMPGWAKVLIIIVALCGVGGVGLGVLGALVMPNVVSKMEEATEALVRADLAQLSDALAHYASENGGNYPGDLDELVTGGYLDGPKMDPWGSPYLYDAPAAPGAASRVYTLGADGEPGGEGLDRDISNEGG